jgi:hypothetical protein
MIFFSKVKYSSWSLELGEIHVEQVELCEPFALPPNVFEQHAYVFSVIEKNPNISLRYTQQ